MLTANVPPTLAEVPSVKVPFTFHPVDGDAGGMVSTQPDGDTVTIAADGGRWITMMSLVRVVPSLSAPLHVPEALLPELFEMVTVGQSYAVAVHAPWVLVFDVPPEPPPESVTGQGVTARVGGAPTPLSNSGGRIESATDAPVAAVPGVLTTATLWVHLMVMAPPTLVN